MSDSVTRMSGSDGPRVAVVGHVEWVRFARVEHVPRAGEVAHAREPIEEPAGGGAVAAVQLARLAGSALLFTALGDDAHGRRSVERLNELGVEVHAAWRAQPTRTAVTLVDDARERTITTFGERLAPLASDVQLPWEALREVDALYFTAGDLGALRAARTAKALVASPRARDALGHGVALDALVLSGDDPVERDLAERARDEAKLVVITDGPRGGSFHAREQPSARGARGDGARARETPGGETHSRETHSRETHGRETHGRETHGRWAATRVPGAVIDSYGCGDSFVAGLTFGLGAGLPTSEAIELGARCGAMCLAGRGPYARQLTAQDIG